MLHLLGNRRRASSQGVALGSDKHATTARSDGRVVSLFRQQSDGALGKTVIGRLDGQRQTVAAWLDRRTLRAELDRRLNCLTDASLRATK